MEWAPEYFATYLQSGETVLVLGLGNPELCARALCGVGTNGRVLAVDPEASRVAEARQWEPPACPCTCPPLEVRQVFLHDLALDVEQVETFLGQNPLASLEDLRHFEALRDELRRSQPVVTADSVDVVLAENVLSRIDFAQLPTFFAETYRVLKRGGRMLLADSVADEDVPARLRRAGRVPGPWRERALLEAFEAARFYGIQILRITPEAVTTVEGIEFREALIVARKGKEGACMERNQAVIYKGPWSKVTDDDGHTLPRGVRIAVCDKTFNLYAQAPYREDVILIAPRDEIPLEKAKPFDCSRDVERPAWETKGWMALSRQPLVTVAHKRSPSSPEAGDGQEPSGLGYLVHAEWRSATGSLERHVKITPRFSAYYETAQEALEASQKIFPDATRHRVEALPVEELRARKPHGRMWSCPLDKGRG